MDASLERVLKEDGERMRRLARACEKEDLEKLKYHLHQILAHPGQKVTPRLSPELAAAWRAEGEFTESR